MNCNIVDTPSDIARVVSDTLNLYYDEEREREGKKSECVISDTYV